MKKCFIITAIELPLNIKNLISPADFVIAVDGGYYEAIKQGIIPNEIMGDFDSANAPNIKENITVLPCEKDDTDTFYAIKYALNRGFKNITILGGTGGRLDHTFANLMSLEYIANHGGEGWIYSSTAIATVVKNKEITLQKNNSKYIGIYSLTDKSIGVSIKGLKYEIDDYTLTREVPIGTSNEFASEKAIIKVNDGTILLVYSNFQDLT